MNTCIDYDSDEKDDEDEYAIMNFEEYYDERDFEGDDLENLMNKIDLNDDNISPLSFTTTIRGNRKLVCDGYSYVRDRGDYNLFQWKCNFSVRVKRADGKVVSVYCPGRCHTINDKCLKIVMSHQSSIGNRMHLPDPCLIECFVSIDECKKMEKIPMNNNVYQV